MRLFANDARLQATEHNGSSMKLCSIAALVVVLAAVPFRCLAAEEGVAVAIVYDTSGSMKESVQDSNGKQSPKYVIANRALKDIARQIQAFSTNNASGSVRRVDAGVFVFQGDNAREAIKFGPFDPKPIQQFANTFSSPGGSTPLGNALRMASKAVLDSPLSRKHVLVITDGKNTAGPDPAVVLPRLKQQAAQSGGALSVHFVAFNVDAKEFEAVKQQGATVVGAADEKQLNTQLEFIMQRKILLEEEEPAKKK